MASPPETMSSDAAAAAATTAGGGKAWPVALAGLVSLAVAMGIGRFAFTPLMPMMLNQGLLELPAAGWLASINYFGYLTGALLCMLQPWIARRLKLGTAVDAPRVVRWGLVSTALLTSAMALHWPSAWPSLRYLAGIVSALVFVYTSGWCLSRLAQLGAGRLGGVIYAGPGAGIVVSGLSASGMVAAGWTAGVGWSLFGVLAAALTALVWRTVREPIAAAAAVKGVAAASVSVAVPTSSAAPVRGPVLASSAAMAAARNGSNSEASAPTATAGRASIASGVGSTDRAELILLSAGYGLAGFGYIVTATFLPVIARQAVPGSAWIDLFWPILGAAVVVGALLASRLPEQGDRRLRLAGGYSLQAAGILTTLAWPSLPGFVIGSILVGLPFTAITLFAMQDLRRLRPQAAASAMGFATVLYGIGQILGPVLVSLLLRHSRTSGQGFDWALGCAAGVLLVGVALFLAMVRVFPLTPTGPRGPTRPGGASPP